MSKLNLVLKGLDCANCASKIESGINELPAVSKASLNFSSSKLFVEYSKISQKDLSNQIEGIVHNLEPDVKILTEGSENSIEEHSHGEETSKKRLILIAVSVVFFVLGLIFKEGAPALPLFLVSLAAAGGETLLKALKNITKGKIFDENFLMSIATIGAFAIGDYAEGAAVMLFYQVGEYFQDLAVHRSRKSISDLLNIRPDFANVMRNGEVISVSPSEIEVFEKIVIRPGERIPLDGEIITGSSSLDTSALTGESLPREVIPGDTVLSGAVNISGLLEVSVTKPFSESTASKILALVEEAGSRKAPAEQFITKFARYYTPAVVLIAALIAIIPPLFFAQSFSEFINRALIFLVVSCPCALVISVPLSFFGGLGASSKNGVLIKGGNYLEALADVGTVVFDKTGTLTQGKFSVSGIYPFGITEAELLKTAAHVEHYSNHPIAKSICAAYSDQLQTDLISEYKELSGFGVSAKIGNHEVLAGNAKLMSQNGLQIENPTHSGSVVHLAINGNYAGYIIVEDKIKPDSKAAIESLKALGISKTVMLTGDNDLTGRKVASQLGIDEVFTELLPADKVSKIEALQKDVPKGKKLLFVGDGINDAPSLARADVGVAMGGVGSDAAVEAADMVIMNDEPSKLKPALIIAGKTRVIVWQNIIFALGIKAVILILGALGYASMWAAVFADVGVSLIAIINALRIISYKD